MVAIDGTHSRQGRAPRRRSWFSRVLAVLTVACFVAGALLLADTLRFREDVAHRVANSRVANSRVANSRVADNRAAPGPVRADPGLPVDRGMVAYLDPDVAYVPVRETRFASDRALYTVGPSRLAPQTLFRRVLHRLNPQGGRLAQDAALRLGPSAAAGLRMQASVGVCEGVGFLVRMPPDAAAAAEGRLRTERGGIILAYGRKEGWWEYLTFYFPQGLDLDAFVQQFGPPPDVFETLAPELERVLHPALALGGQALDTGTPHAPRPPVTILCRAEGEAGEALDTAVAVLERRGWRRLPGVAGGPGSEDTRVLGSPRGQVWFTTPDRNQEGGMVTVMMDLP